MPLNNPCPKFLPNIFNKSKCSQCFRVREEHFCSNNTSISGNNSTTFGSSNTKVKIKWIYFAVIMYKLNFIKFNQLTNVETTGIRQITKCGHLFIPPPLGPNPTTTIQENRNKVKLTGTFLDGFLFFMSFCRFFLFF